MPQAKELLWGWTENRLEEHLGGRFSRTTCLGGEEKVGIKDGCNYPCNVVKWGGAEAQRGPVICPSLPN